MKRHIDPQNVSQPRLLLGCPIERCFKILVCLGSGPGLMTSGVLARPGITVVKWAGGQWARGIVVSGVGVQWLVVQWASGILVQWARGIVVSGQGVQWLVGLCAENVAWILVLVLSPQVSLQDQELQWFNGQFASGILGQWLVVQLAETPALQIRNHWYRGQWVCGKVDQWYSGLVVSGLSCQNCGLDSGPGLVISGDFARPGLVASGQWYNDWWLVRQRAEIVAWIQSSNGTE